MRSFHRFLIVLLASAWLSACAPIVIVVTPTPMPLVIPTIARPTDMPSAVPRATSTLSATATILPSETPTPLPSATFTPTPTATPTETSVVPVSSPAPATDAPTAAPPTSAPVVIRVTPNASGQYDLDPRYTGHFSNIGPSLRAIFERGQALGRNAHAFMRMGDSEATKPEFLNPFEYQGYDLGDYDYLQVVIDHFDGSFRRVGLATFPGSTPAIILDPTWADPNFCLEGEGPLACEIRVHNPAVALIMTRTWAGEGGPPGSEFEVKLRQVVEYCVAQGVIPVLMTHVHHVGSWPPSEPQNETIRKVANEYKVPLWDMYVTAEGLPQRGNDTGNHFVVHPDGGASYFYGDYMNYAKTHHNLESLEILHAVLTLVILQ